MKPAKKPVKEKTTEHPGFWPLWKEFCMETTIQGPKYFYLYPDKLSRIIWTVMALFSVVMAYSLTNLLYNRFADMPTRITIDEQFAPVTGLPFPAITICTPNQMTISNMIHFNRTLIDGDLDIDLHRVLPKLLGFYEIVNNINDSDLLHLQDLITKNRHIIPSVMYSLAQPCSEFLKLCSLAHNLSDCSEIFRPIMTRHGLCCIFNSPYYFDKDRNVRDPTFKPWHTDRGGVLSALSLVYDYNPHDAINYTLLNSGSTRISFNDWTEFPSDDETSLIYAPAEVFLLIFGSHTYCSDEVASLPSDSRRCLFDNEPGVTFPGQPYRNSDCDTMCFIKHIESKCHCLPFHMPGYRKVQLCNLTSIPCISKSRKEQAHEVDTDPCDCPRDCDSRKYKVDTSIGKFDAVQHMAVHPLGSMKLNRSTNFLHFSFANAFYMKQKQETVMSLISLASNLGGVFGLCMGISALSVCEVLFFLYKLIRNYHKNRCMRKAAEAKKLGS